MCLFVMYYYFLVFIFIVQCTYKYYMLIVHIQKCIELEYFQIYNIEEQNIGFMAFVFRSPRNLDVLENIEASGSNAVEKQHVQLHKEEDKKSPMKGLAFKNINKLGIKKQQRKDSLKQQIEKFSQKIKVTSKNNKQNRYNQKILNSSNEANEKNNYVFKSKLRRQLFINNNQKILKTQKYVDNDRPCIKKQVNQLNNSTKKPIQSCSVIQQQKQSNQKNINLLIAKKSFDKIQYVPSIPNKLEKYGYVLKEQNLSYPKLINRGRFQGDKNDYPGPCDYNTVNKKSVKGVLKFQYMSRPKSDNQNIFDASFGNSPVLIHNKEALKIHNQKIQQWIQKGKQQKKDIPGTLKNKVKHKKIIDIDSENTDSDGQQYQYEFDTPGPGYYTYDPFKKKDFRSNKSNYKKIFYSECQRFKKQDHSGGIYQDQDRIKQNKEPKQKIKFFASKLPRQSSLQMDTIAPPPGYYDPRTSMLDSVITKMLKNSTKITNNNIPRVPIIAQSHSPGPGSYSLDPPNFKVQSFLDKTNNNMIIADNSVSHSNKTELLSLTSTRENAAQNILIQKSSPKPKSHMRIHERINEQISKKNHAPFMSLSPNGLNIQSKQQYSPDLKKQRLYRLQNQRRDKIQQNNYPFNSTQSVKNGSPHKSGIKASVGLYEVANSNQWNKKSFNMYFH